MHHAKNRGNKDTINTIKDISLPQSCLRTYNSGKGLPHDCGSILDSILLRGLPCLHDFSHGASHPYIPINSIE